MVISARTRSIFVHIQKTGGVSIETMLRRGDPAIGSSLHHGRRHLFARDIRPLVASELWDGYFKFAFVRNPWDRLVSWYHMCAQASAPNAFARHVQQNARTFDEFVTRTTTGIAERTTWNQLDYVTDDDGNAIVDFIGRYERLHEDSRHVGERLGLAADLPHANRSAHAHYRDYYTDETRDIVARRFARDIRHFGYEF
jgi:chondroitin 4-sulfotransferase 11